MRADIHISTKQPPVSVRLELHDDHAKTVCIAGTFNDWHPETTPMLTTRPGQWTREIALPPGIYEYQYVVDGRWINDPRAVKSTLNPFGGRNSVLVVEESNNGHGTESNRAARTQRRRRTGGRI